jgi:hypothetical protein
MTTSEPGPACGPGDGPGEDPGKAGDAEIVALLVGELRAATAAARARGATAEQVLALVEERRRALRRCRAVGAAGQEPAGPAADASAPGIDGRASD